MMCFKRFLPVFWVSLLLLLSCNIALAQGRSADNPGHAYGVGQPKSTQDLPNGKLRRDLDSLPAKARGKALGWLQGFSFPAEDVESLRVTADGSIHYADTFVPVNTSSTTDEYLASSAAMDPTQVFRLHSKPGASNVVFLDFDGHTLSGTAWSISTLVALPFDPSQNDSPSTVANFTTDEMTRIAEIWHRISEDYAAFNIDVTTEEPAVFTPTTGHVLFTHDVDATGQAFPGQGGGGIAYVNVYGRSDYVSRYSPALVYYTNLYGIPSYTAEAGSHEFGHNIGLSHDGVVGGTAYYSGHGSGLVSWAPIMGSAYTTNVTQWSKGEYPNANNTQDDLAIIAGDLGYAADDHGDSAALATQMLVEANGDILVSNPELDPDNLLPENKGTIDDRTDVDWFFVDVADTATLSITATPAWHAFTQISRRGANLDVELALFDSNLTLLAVGEPDDDTNATVAVSVTTGRYYLQVDGVGNDTNSDFSDYASLGMYFLEGSVQTSLGDSTPPSPAIMSWQTTPNATGTSTISMTAVTATDDTSGVEYLFSCVAGGTGCTDSDWQTSQSFTASGLDQDTYYAYTVRARDASGNQNVASSSTGDTTDAPPPPPPPPLPSDNQAPVANASYSPSPVVLLRGKTVKVTLDGSGSVDPDGSITGWSWTDANGSSVSTSATVTIRLPVGVHGFTLMVTDNNGATNSTNLSISVTKK